MEFNREHDQHVRAAALAWLKSQVSQQGDVVSHDVLKRGFEYGRERVKLIGPPGIFKPAIMQLPLSIRTAPNGPYNDEIGSDNTLLYKYRGDNPYHRDNMGLRMAMQYRLPLIYFYGLVRGRYLAIGPVYIVSDSIDDLAFLVTCEEAGLAEPVSSLQVGELQRSYANAEVQRRIHQSAFRERVLLAYEHKCAFCCLRHTELLDAAHIIPDSKPHGEPIVSNGMSLCRLHHATFDSFILGVQPKNYSIQVRRDVLEEIDGPTLKHSIQGLQGQQILLPRKVGERPGVERLEERWEQFLAVG